jgi:catechol 2,3-dioxygenase-like lactoylglutathione lyase family enzyme
MSIYRREHTMSRVQLALNVSDLPSAIEFYTKLFGTEPAKVREGYANFAIVEPPLKLVLIEGGGEPGSLNHLGVEVESTELVTSPSRGCSRRVSPPTWRRDHVLLRGAGQGVGTRSRRRTVGGLHRVGRCCSDDPRAVRLLRPCRRERRAGRSDRHRCQVLLTL